MPNIIDWNKKPWEWEPWERPEVVSCGTRHVTALKKAGTLVSWGDDIHNQVTDTPSSNDFVQVSCGRWHVTAIKEDGSLVSWGHDEYNQVTDTPSGNDFVQVSCGIYHATALKEDGTLVSWGSDNHNQVSDTPTDNNFVQVSCGHYHATALKEDGTLVSWGDDSHNAVSDTPTGNDFVQVSCGYWHVTTIKEDGSLVSWGYDEYNQVTDTPSGNDFVQVSCGGYHATALKSNGSLLSWGNDGENQVSDTPTGNDFVQVSCGGQHITALKEDGSLVSWGADGENQVSDTPTSNDFFIFIRIYILETDNLLLNPLYPFKNKDNNINLNSELIEEEDSNIDIRYRVLLNNEHIYPESPYPYSETPTSNEDYMSTATGYETPEGVISASSEFSDSYLAWYVFNGTPDDPWMTEDSVTTGWLEIALNDPTVINGYSITSRNHEDMGAPVDWTFEGSNDGVDWEVLDTRENETSWSQDETREYTFGNKGKYSYYRINVSASDGTATYLAIGEMELFEPGETKGYTELQTTPFDIDINLNPNRFDIGENTLIMEVISPETLQSNEILNLTIIKEDRDTFTIERNLQYDGSVNITGDVIIDNDKGITLSSTGSGSAIIEIPTEGKARILSNKLETNLYFISETTAIPAMTNNTSPEGEVSASSYISSNYQPFRAFDGIANTINTGSDSSTWVSSEDNNTEWLQYKFSSEIIIGGYSIIPQSSPETYLSRTPKDWTFEGSNDGENWDILDTQSDIVWDSYEIKKFFFKNSNQYKYYRINITANNGSSLVSIGEMEMFEKSILNEKIESITTSDDMNNQGSSGDGTLFEKEINTDLDITNLEIGLKSNV